MQPGATGVRPIGEYSASFVTRWSSHETMQPYDALRDKHASNYFDSGPVKKHLDKLRKAIELYPLEDKQYTDRLSEKLKELEREKRRLDGKAKPYERGLKPYQLYEVNKIKRFLNQKMLICRRSAKRNRPNVLEYGAEGYIKYTSKTLLPKQRGELPPLGNRKKACATALSNIADKQRGPSSQNNLTRYGTSSRLYSSRVNEREKDYLTSRYRAISQRGQHELKHGEFIEYLKRKQQEVRYKSIKQMAK